MEPLRRKGVDQVRVRQSAHTTNVTSGALTASLVRSSAHLAEPDTAEDRVRLARDRGQRRGQCRATSMWELSAPAHH